MVEPVSMTIGAVSFTLGVVGFLITTVFTTVSKLEEKAREYKEYEDRIRAHQRALIACQIKLCDWNRVWSGHPNAVYEHLWGADGVREVKNRTSEILKLARVIEKATELSDAESRLGREQLLRSTMSPVEWRSLLQSLGFNTQASLGLSDAKVSVLRKLAFLLYKNNSLQEKTGRLKEMTTQLTDYTNSLMRLGQYPYVVKAPDHAEIQDFARLKSFVDSVSKIGEELHKATQEQSQVLRWALALRTPDKDGDPELWGGVNDITCQFCVRLRTSGDQWNRCVIKIRHFFDVSIDRASLKANIIDVVLTEMKTGREHFNIPKAFTYAVPPPKGRPRSLKSYLSQSTLAGRSTSSYYHHKKLRIALGLVNWIILYWNTRWTESPCSCKIRILKYEDESDQPILYHRRRDGSGCQHHDQKECQVGEKLLLLGVTLAEIALLAPVRVEHNGTGLGGLSFVLRNEATSFENLQGKIRDAVGYKGLHGAIQFCFSTWPHLTAFRPELIKLFTAEVLTP